MDKAEQAVRMELRATSDGRTVITWLDAQGNLIQEVTMSNEAFLEWMENEVLVENSGLLDE